MKAGTQMSVSTVLLTYNQVNYVSAAFRALCAQTRASEIVVADDGSTDGTFEVLSRLVRGLSADLRARTTVLPSQPNRGLVGNLNRAVAAARGEIIVVASGDDVSSPLRIERTVAEFLGDRRIRLVATGVRTICDGVVSGPPEWWNPGQDRTIALEDLPSGKEFWTLGASTAIHRDVISHFWPLDSKLILEDHVLPLRALLLGSVRIVAAPLVDYRLVPGSLRGLAEWPPERSRSELAKFAARAIEGRRALLQEIRLLAMARQAQGADPGGGILNSLIDLECGHVAVLEAMSKGVRWSTVAGLARGLTSRHPATRSLCRRGALLAYWPAIYDRVVSGYHKTRRVSKAPRE